MSARALNWAWECVPSSRPAKLILVALADRADEDGICWPSFTWLARKCAPTSEEAVKRAFKSLDDEGYFAEKERRRRDDGTFSTWRIRLAIDQGAKMTTGSTTGQKCALEPPGENDPAYYKEPSPNADALGAEAGIGRKIDPLWEALVDAIRTAPPVTRSGRGAWNAAVKELREAGADPSTILAAADNYRRTWPDITLTPTALAKHWHVFALEPEARRARIAASTCDECGIGGGLHLADCSKAEVAA